LKQGLLQILLLLANPFVPTLRRCAAQSDVLGVWRTCRRQVRQTPKTSLEAPQALSKLEEGRVRQPRKLKTDFARGQFGPYCVY